MIGRAGLDGENLNRTIDDFIRQALAQNASIEVMNHPQGRHGILDPDVHSREIIARAVAFLKTHLNAP